MEEIRAKVARELEKAFQEGKTYVLEKRDWLASFWSGFKSPDQMSRVKTTGVEADTLLRVGKQIASLPPGFNVHRGVRKVSRESPFNGCVCVCMRDGKEEHTPLCTFFRPSCVQKPPGV